MSNIIKQIKQIKLYFIAFEGLFFSKVNQRLNSHFKCKKDTVRCCENSTSPNYKYHITGGNIPLCCASHLVNILKDVTICLEKHKAEYFISFGTLLGAVRHGGIIPWDTDIDIIIPQKDEGSIYSLLLKELGKKYYIRIDEDDKLNGGKLIRVFLSKQNNLHVDLFSYIDNTKEISFYTNKKFEKKNIFPLQKIGFYKLKLFAPKNIDNHLSILYGNDYMIYAYKQWAANKRKFKIQSFEAAKIDRVN